MFIELAEWFDEGHFRQLARPRRGDELGLILQMLGATSRAVSEVGEVGEWLMMILEQLGGVTADGVVPSPRVPGPGNLLVRKPIPDRRIRLVRNQRRARGVGRMRSVDREGSVD